MNRSDTGSIDEATRPWSFDEFVGAGMALIPAYAPDWTNHNPSDPGITLVELFAYLSEVLAYRALRVTPDAKLHFLRLLEGGVANDPAIRPGIASARLDEAIGARVAALSHAACLVTAGDFDRAAQAAALEALGANAILRTRTIIGADLRDAARTAVSPGAAPADITVILAPERELDDAELERLCEHVRLTLAPRSLLTTRVHVLGPVVLHVAIGCRVALEPGTTLGAAATAIDAALRRRFGPGEADDPPDLAAAGQPFGGALHLLEIVEVIDGVDGVDWVEQVSVRRIHAGGEGRGEDGRVGLRVGETATIAADTRLGGIVSIAQRRLLREDDGEVVSVSLQPWEQVRVRLDRDALEPIGDSAAGSADADGRRGR